MKRLFYTVLILIVLGAVGVGGYFGTLLLEGTGPELKIIAPDNYLGKSSRVVVMARDKKSGLRNIQLVIQQGDKRVELEKKTFQIVNWWQGSPVKETTAEWDVNAKRLGFKNGDAQIIVLAHDASLRGELKGNLSEIKKAVTIDITPPRISLVSEVHNVRIGGSGLVTYKVNEDVKKSGILVGDTFFKPFDRDAQGQYSCLFAIPVLAEKSNRNIFIIAEDMAGNMQKRGFFYDILPFRPKRDRIRITDGFLRKKMPEFAQLLELPPDTDLLQVFLTVNNRIRQDNNKALLSYCKGVTGPPVWKGRFKALPNAAKRAGFADERHYYYKGKEIDQAYHMGLDLASIKNAPVPAANFGKVVFAGDLGIYGNTVILDHGAGLYTSYSHLGAITVTPGDEVKKGEIIGRTDTTGLAGGDHLHFATIVQGVFVNPIEWLDEKWIRDHIEKNM